MPLSEHVILLDPYPRPIELIFSPEDKARLEQLGSVIWHDGSPAPDTLIEEHLLNTVAIIGQTLLPRERLECAPHLRMIAKRLMAYVSAWNAQAHPFNWSTKSEALVMAKCEAQATCFPAA